jgi:hypothetical protein
VQIILQRCGSSLAEHEGQKLAGVSSRSLDLSRILALSEFAPGFALMLNTANPVPS